MQSYPQLSSPVNPHHGRAPIARASDNANEDQNKRRESQRKSYATNRDKRSEYDKKYYELNRDKKNEYERKRRASDPSFKLVQNMRRSLNNVLKKTKSTKTQRTHHYLGCSLQWWTTEYWLSKILEFTGRGCRGCGCPERMHGARK